MLQKLAIDQARACVRVRARGRVRVRVRACVRVCVCVHLCCDRRSGNLKVWFPDVCRCPSEAPEEIGRLITDCMQADAELRPTARQIVQRLTDSMLVEA